MRKLTYNEIYQIYLQYRDIKEPIKVVDFKTAQDRCKQIICENFKKKQAAEKRKYRQRPDVRRREYAYRGKLLRGEIDIPSSKSLKRFVSVIKNKYGSLSNYHSISKYKELLAKDLK